MLNIIWRNTTSKDSTTDKFLRNIFFVAPIIYIISIFTSFTVLYWYNGWDAYTTIFYSTQNLLGCLYGVPDYPNPSSKFLTLIIYLWGYILQATAVGVLATAIVDNVTQIERKKARNLVICDIDGDGEVGIIDLSYYHYLRVLDYLGFYNPQIVSKYMVLGVALIWIILGAAYAHLYEEYSIIESLFFAIATIAQFGAPAPPCEQKVVSSSGSVTFEDAVDPTHCSLKPFRAAFFTVYIMIGVPLFNIVLGT